MKRMTTIVFIGLLALALIVPAFAYAENPQDQGPRDPAAMPTSGDVEESFVGTNLLYFPVPPCRIIDTRVSGGPIIGGTQRNFIASGLCGIPFPQAKAVMMNIVATQSAGAGNLRAFAYPEAVPFAAVLNYGIIPGLNAIGNAAIIPICDNTTHTCSYDLSIWVSTTTHVVVDVMGYFRQ